MFDAYPFAKSMGLLEVFRDEEFAPVKNAPGTSEDSPDTARALISKLHHKWASKAGIKIIGNTIYLNIVSPYNRRAGFHAKRIV